FIFFFQAEDGIRDFHVTGVQTCALPISKASNDLHPPCQRCSFSLSEPQRCVRQQFLAPTGRCRSLDAFARYVKCEPSPAHGLREIGRASCREGRCLSERKCKLISARNRI